MENSVPCCWLYVSNLANSICGLNPKMLHTVHMYTARREPKLKHEHKPSTPRQNCKVYKLNIEAEDLKN